MSIRPAQRMISKPTLAVVKQELTTLCTHNSMANLFEQYGFEIYPGSSFMNKLGRANAHLDNQNWTDPDVARRLLDLLAHRFAEIASWGEDNLQRSESFQRISRILAEREGFIWNGQGFTATGSATLVHVAETAARFDSAAMHREVERIFKSVDTDPDDAITASKSLVEATCRAILADYGEEPASGTDLGSLTKTTLKYLRLLPGQVSDASRGADASKKVLHSLATAIQGLAELRNLYGDAHGKGPGHNSLEPRHARVTAAFAGGLTTFMMETHEQRRKTSP